MKFIHNIGDNIAYIIVKFIPRTLSYKTRRAVRTVARNDYTTRLISLYNVNGIICRGNVKCAWAKQNNSKINVDNWSRVNFWLKARKQQMRRHDFFPLNKKRNARINDTSKAIQKPTASTTWRPETKYFASAMEREKEEAVGCVATRSERTHTVRRRVPAPCSLRTAEQSLGDGGAT